MSEASKPKFSYQIIILLIITLIAITVAIYAVIVPIYEVAHELNVLNTNIKHLDKSVQGIVQEKDIGKLSTQFKKLNKQIDDSTLLGF